MTGLHDVLASAETWDRTARAVRWRSEPVRATKFQTVTLSWDGRAFKVAIKRGELGADARQAPME